MRESAASPEEAAAIAAAIEQFLRDTAPAPARHARPGGWARDAVLGAAGLGPHGPGPWGDPEPWGRSSQLG
jgi:hypothetical protein